MRWFQRAQYGIPTADLLAAVKEPDTLSVLTLPGLPLDVLWGWPRSAEHVARPVLE